MRIRLANKFGSQGRKLEAQIKALCLEFWNLAHQTPEPTLEVRVYDENYAGVALVPTRDLPFETYRFYDRNPIAVLRKTRAFFAACLEKKIHHMQEVLREHGGAT